MHGDWIAEDLILKYDRPVPRYTSFPTAVQFTPDLPSGMHENLLAELDVSMPVSIYVHIPFCHSLCHYCGCHTKIVQHYTPIRAYFETLLQEIDLVGNALSVKPAVNLIHFGGGSPNYAESADLEDVIDRLSKYFQISGKTSIDIECDPRLLNSQKIDTYVRLGVTRVSLGVQDFDEAVQRAINRFQPYSMVEKCVSDLREAGINCINFDLITGLPRQTLETVERTAELAASLRPDRVAVFPYAHVPWMKKHQKLLEGFARPDSRMRFAMNLLVRERLLAEGYNAIGIDHFAIGTDRLSMAASEGRLRRNFQGYTDDTCQTIIGLGLSSISSFKKAYVQNETDGPAYRYSLANGKLPAKKGCVLTEEDTERRRLIEDLMCRFTADLNDYPAVKMPGDKLALLEYDKLITIDKNVIRVTGRGMPFTRVVAACFDPYLNNQENHHARAI